MERVIYQNSNDLINKSKKQQEIICSPPLLSAEDLLYL